MSNNNEAGKPKEWTKKEFRKVRYVYNIFLGSIIGIALAGVAEGIADELASRPLGVHSPSEIAVVIGGAVLGGVFGELRTLNRRRYRS